MGRPAYQITKHDFVVAKAYLKKRCGAECPEVHHLDTPEELQIWCEERLHPVQWKRLKATILQERKRGADEVAGRKLKTINLTEHAWKELNTLQRNLNDAGFDVTYSDLVKALAAKYNGKDARSAARQLEIQREMPV